MRVKAPWKRVSKLPPLCDGVQAGRDDIEVACAVIAGTGVLLRCAGSLKVQSNVPVRRDIPEDVLALEFQRAPALEAELNVGGTFLIERNALCDSRNRA